MPNRRLILVVFLLITKKPQTMCRLRSGARGSKVELFWVGFIRIGYLLSTLIFEINCNFFDNLELNKLTKSLSLNCIPHYPLYLITFTVISFSFRWV